MDKFEWLAEWRTRSGWVTSGTFPDMTRDEVEKVIIKSGGVIISLMVVGGPMQKSCPNCNSQPGYLCTQPTNTSRTNVTWFHSSR